MNNVNIAIGAVVAVIVLGFIVGMTRENNMHEGAAVATGGYAMAKQVPAGVQGVDWDYKSQFEGAAAATGGYAKAKRDEPYLKSVATSGLNELNASLLQQASVNAITRSISMPVHASYEFKNKLLLDEITRALKLFRAANKGNTIAREDITSGTVAVPSELYHSLLLHSDFGLFAMNQDSGLTSKYNDMMANGQRLRDVLNA